MTSTIRIALLCVALLGCGKVGNGLSKTAPMLHTKPGDTRAIIYGAEWCEACGKAGTWLSAHGYTVIDRDIEKERDGATAMQDALDAVGVPSGGVPVIELEGTVVVGFDEKKLESLTKR